MARKSLLTPGAGERLLAAKLQILAGTGNRRPSSALNILTGGSAALRFDDLPSIGRTERQFAPRTVYLAERHLRDIDRIIDAWEQVESRRLNRSAVLRRAVEHLRTLVEAENH